MPHTSLLIKVHLPYQMDKGCAPWVRWAPVGAGSVGLGMAMSLVVFSQLGKNLLA